MYARGMGAMSSKDCRASSACTAFENLVCYGPGYLTEYCSQWRGGLDPPPSLSAPTIDTTPGSPTYGQAMVDGHVVASADDANKLVDELSMQQIRDWQAQNKLAFDNMGSFWTVPGIADWSNPFDPAGDGLGLIPVALFVGAVALFSVMRH